MNRYADKMNTSKTCQKLNGACINLEAATDSLMDRIHSISSKINDLSKVKKIENNI